MGKSSFKEVPDLKYIFSKENCAWKPKYKMKEARHGVKKRRDMELIKRKHLKVSHLYATSHHASDLNTYRYSDLPPRLQLCVHACLLAIST